MAVNATTGELTDIGIQQHTPDLNVFKPVHILRLPRGERSSSSWATRLTRHFATLGVVVVACALGGCADIAASGSPAASRLKVDGHVVQAHTLPGDRLMAGPVLLDHRAVWVEAGHRLLVRSLDVHGRTRTIFSTSKTPGAPKDVVWPFSVSGISAGYGRVAFVESVTPCASAPPHLRGCTPAPGEERRPYSVTLFAGPPGAIRPVETAVRPPCNKQPEPQAVEVARTGLVVNELEIPCGTRPFASRRVLRSFSGGLVRVLAQGKNAETPLVIAGDWALIPSEYGEPGPVQIVRFSTGKTVRRLPRRCWLRFTDGIALDDAGEFALMNDSDGPRQNSCQQQHGNIVRVGQIGNGRLRILATHVGEATSTASIAIADGYVAYGRQTAGSRTDTQVMVAAPGSTPTPIPGMNFGPLAFDGRTLATVHDNIVQLTALRPGLPLRLAP